MNIPTSFGSIRPWQEEDAAGIARYANNRKIWLNLRDGFPHPYTEDHARSFISSVNEKNPVTVFAISTPIEAIGSIGLSINSDVHRLTAEMGYWLAEPYWGQGMMSETVLKFTKFAFDQFGLVRIYAEPFAYNKASCRVLENAGFSLEGQLRSSVIKDGKIIDQYMYAIINDKKN